MSHSKKTRLKSPSKDGDILDVQAAADLLKVSKETLYKKVKANSLPYARIGRRLLFHRKSLIEWVATGGDKDWREPELSSEEPTLDNLSTLLRTGKAQVGRSK